MIRVLHIFYEMHNGGVEHYVMNNYRHIDRTKVQFDFLVSVDRPGFFDSEIVAMGGKIHRAYPLRKNPLRNFMDIMRIIRENNYQIVHRHTGSSFGYYELRAAKLAGVRHLIIHSHNNRARNMLLHRCCSRILTIPCKKLACSQDAGEWLFGKDGTFQVMTNSVDCSKYQFSNEIRSSKRKELGLEGKFVLGHIGRFEEQKNQSRLLDIFKACTEIRNDSVLVCVGIGVDQEACIRKAHDLGIEDKVLFLGARADVPELLQAFDCFLLPSLYEGFPLVLIEAQASGLQCIASTYVPTECNTTGNVHFLSLEETNKAWAEQILGQHSLLREDYARIMTELGYDIRTNAQALCQYYFSLLEKV